MAIVKGFLFAGVLFFAASMQGTNLSIKSQEIKCF